MLDLLNIGGKQLWYPFMFIFPLVYQEWDRIAPEKGLRQCDFEVPSSLLLSRYWITVPTSSQNYHWEVDVRPHKVCVRQQFQGRQSQENFLRSGKHSLSLLSNMQLFSQWNKTSPSEEKGFKTLASANLKVNSYQQLLAPTWDRDNSTVSTSFI